MYYLIDTPHHPRPYLSTISFIANDFANWGCRITRYASSTPYIAEIRYQEKRIRPAHRRIELMEIWAKEVLSRKQQQTAPASIDAPTTDARKERASAFVQDFITSLSVFGKPAKPPTHTCLTPTPRIPHRSARAPTERSPPPPRLPHRTGCEVHPSPPPLRIQYQRSAALLGCSRRPRRRPRGAGFPVREECEARTARVCA